MPDPQLIQVKKYPNRRLYDRTRSRHLTHEELYDLVVAGHTVSVTDSKTGADITNLVLMQAIIERSPEKFASIPPEVVHLMIRANEQLLRSMASGWFTQLMRGAGPLGAPMGGAQATTPSTRTPGFAWPAATGFPWQAAAAPNAVAELQARMEAIAREMDALKGSRDRAT